SRSTGKVMVGSACDRARRSAQREIEDVRAVACGSVLHEKRTSANPAGKAFVHATSVRTDDVRSPDRALIAQWGSLQPFQSMRVRECLSALSPLVITAASLVGRFP